MEKDNLANARAQGLAQLSSIKEMTATLKAAQESADYSEIENAEQTIREDALSVEVRTGWYLPGGKHADTSPAEYKILLCTGGPAAQIVGALSEHMEPETATLQVQDWFTPWTDLRVSQEDTEAMLAYARVFYFGE